ncbi:hypothetical protein [Mesorhizobium marinum]|uniref:Uncharacterized protein n=1 Tax=Mesorhizobium marinum TaxID=3228790 RepID=A0ABV3QZB5_9HYPH
MVSSLQSIAPSNEIAEAIAAATYTLDQQISDALSSATISSIVIAEIRDAAAEAEIRAREDHAEAKQIALDPKTTPEDARKARDLMVDKQFFFDRISSAVQALNAHLVARRDQEHQSSIEKAERIAIERHADAVHAIEAKYGELASQLSALLSEYLDAREQKRRLGLAVVRSVKEIGFSTHMVKLPGHFDRPVRNLLSGD